MIKTFREGDTVYMTADSYLEILESPNIDDWFKELLRMKIPPAELGRRHNCGSTIYERSGITRVEAAPIEIHVT